MPMMRIQKAVERQAVEQAMLLTPSGNSRQKTAVRRRLTVEMRTRMRIGDPQKRAFRRRLMMIRLVKKKTSKMKKPKASSGSFQPLPTRPRTLPQKGAGIHGVTSSPRIRAMWMNPRTRTMRKIESRVRPRSSMTNYPSGENTTS